MIRVDVLHIHSNVRVYLHNKNNVIEVFEGHNTFQTNGYNYIRNALINGGSFVPIDEMSLIYSDGTSTVNTNNSAPSVGAAKFIAIWAEELEFTSITRFSLLASSTEYSRLDTADFNKVIGYVLTIEWIISFS